MSGQVRSGQVRSGQVRSGRVMWGPINSIMIKAYSAIHQLKSTLLPRVNKTFTKKKHWQLTGWKLADIVVHYLTWIFHTVFAQTYRCVLSKSSSIPLRDHVPHTLFPAVLALFTRFLSWPPSTFPESVSSVSSTISALKCFVVAPVHIVVVTHCHTSLSTLSNPVNPVPLLRVIVVISRHRCHLATCYNPVEQDRSEHVDRLDHATPARGVSEQRQFSLFKRICQSIRRSYISVAIRPFSCPSDSVHLIDSTSSIHSRFSGRFTSSRWIQIQICCRRTEINKRWICLRRPIMKYNCILFNRSGDQTGEQIGEHRKTEYDLVWQKTKQISTTTMKHV